MRPTRRAGGRALPGSPADLPAALGLGGDDAGCIAPDRRAWRVLGFSSAPRTKVRPPHTGLRMDLYEEGVIAECKNVLSGLETLRQLDGYLQLCDRRPSRT